MSARRAILFFAGTALLVTAAAAAAGAGAGVQEDFAAANRKYEEGMFSEALPLYLAVSKRVSDWKVLYDIGNSYYKTGNFLSAKVYYLKARKLRPLEDSIARNIAMTNRRFRDVVVVPEPDFISRTVLRLENALSLDALGVLLLLAILLLNLFLFLLLARGRSRKLLYGLAFSLLLASVVGAYLHSRTAAMAGGSVAVVWEEESRLRSGPGEENTELFKVNPGLEVRIIDRFRDWVQVTASEQIAGWIEKKRLVLI